MNVINDQSGTLGLKCLSHYSNVRKLRRRQITLQITSDHSATTACFDSLMKTES